MINVARNSQVDSIVMYNYGYVARRLRHLELDTIKTILKEGLDYARTHNIEDENTFKLRYADITTDFQIAKPDSIIKKIHAVLPFSHKLPLTYKIRAYRHLGNYHNSKSRFDSAIYYYDLGFKTAKKSNNTLDEIQLQSLLALTYHQGGNSDIGLKMIDAINSEYTKATSSFHFRRAYSIINLSLGNYQKCIDYFIKLNRIHGDTTMIHSFPSVTSNYTEALFRNGEIEKSLKEAQKFYKIQSKGVSKVSAYKYLFTISKCYMALAKPKDAIATMEKAKQNIPAPNTIDQLGVYSKIKCEAYIALGIKDSARYYLEKYVEIEKNEAIRRAKVKYQQTLVAYQTKEMENKVELLAKKSQLDNNKFNSFLLIGALLLFGISTGIYAYFKRRQEKTKRALVEAELTSIRSQMNPHFMFNALNSIKSYIIKEEPRLAAEYLSRFANLIRKILDLSSQKKITLKEELATLDLYVAMEQLRFKNKFDYRVSSNIQVTSYNTVVPPLFLQPFVENAIKHGLSPLFNRTGLLELIIEQKENNLEFIIRDNGIGRQDKESEHKSKGVILSFQRLELWNDGSNIKQPLEIVDLENDDDESSPAGTEVRIRILIKSKE